ncbi:MAG: hypothetical protein R2787_00560 [Saprospiraceae bacterium]
MKKVSFTLKSLFITGLVIGMASFVQAQTVGAGAWMVGGQAGFASASTDGVDDAVNVITIAPNVGYFVIDNLGIGLNLSFTNTSFGDNGVTDIGVGPYARYYVYQGLFPQVGVSYMSSKVKDQDAVTQTDINLGVGYSFFLNNSVAIEPMLAYTIGGGDDPTTNVFGLLIGIQAFLGRN